MSSSIVCLPEEIKFLIIRDDAFKDDLLSLIRLSSTCKPFRALLAPIIFETITFTTESRIANSALVATKAYPHFVISLRFLYQETEEFMYQSNEDLMYDNNELDECEGEICGCCSDNDDSCELDDWRARNQDDTLCSSVRELLSGKYSPNAQSLHVKFEFGSSRGPVEVERPDEEWLDLVHSKPILNAVLREDENRKPWRAKMAMIWHNIANNKAISTLIVHGLIQKPTTTFLTRRWKRFLEQLEHLVISLESLSEYDYGHVSFHNVTRNHFISRLSDFFFDHLINLTSLDFKTTCSRPSLNSDGNVFALELMPQQMPRLQSLRIEYILISPKLVDFLTSHAGTLQKLQMGSCLSAFEWAGQEVIGWAEFFDRYADAEPILCQFECRVDSLDREFCLFPLGDLSEERDEIEILKLFGQSSSYMQIDWIYDSFLYAQTDDVCKIVMQDTTAMIDKAQEGHDMRAYKRLDAVASKNRDREAMQITLVQEV